MPALWTSAGLVVACIECVIRLRCLPALDGIVHSLSTCDHHTWPHRSIMSPLAECGWLEQLWARRPCAGVQAMAFSPQIHSNPVVSVVRHVATLRQLFPPAPRVGCDR